MTWLQTSVIKKVKTISLYALLNINLFLQQTFLIKTCHTIGPDCRYFDKDSKKSSFAILGFFYDYKLNLQFHCINIKSKLDILNRSLVLRLGPQNLALGALERFRARNRVPGRRTEQGPAVPGRNPADSLAGSRPAPPPSASNPAKGQIARSQIFPGDFLQIQGLKHNIQFCFYIFVVNLEIQLKIVEKS